MFGFPTRQWVGKDGWSKLAATFPLNFSNTVFAPQLFPQLFLLNFFNTKFCICSSMGWQGWMEQTGCNFSSHWEALNVFNVLNLSSHFFFQHCCIYASIHLQLVFCVFFFLCWLDNGSCGSKILQNEHMHSITAQIYVIFLSTTQEYVKKFSKQIAYDWFFSGFLGHSLISIMVFCL